MGVGFSEQSLRWREWNHLVRRDECEFAGDLDVVRVAWGRGSTALSR